MFLKAKGKQTYAARLFRKMKAQNKKVAVDASAWLIGMQEVLEMKASVFGSNVFLVNLG